MNQTKIIIPKAIFDFSKDNFLLKDKVLVFDNKIIKICNLDEAKNEFKNAKIINAQKYYLSPVFCNIHSHLEFGTSFLDYGDFVQWLESIIKNREDIDKVVLQNTIKNSIQEMLKSGVGYLGEISSFGAELEILNNSQIKSIVFHEILGANEEVLKKNIDFFENRFYRFSNLKNHISLHSPYSICNKTYDYAINFAKQNNLFISTHYLESKYEKELQHNKNNALSRYLKRFNPSGFNKNFLKDFEDLNAIFTHCNYVDDFKEFKKHHIITTCPRSNRYLNSRTFNIKKALKDKITLSIGTDGLSSNNTLNFFDELRAGLLLYKGFNLSKLAHILFKASVFDASHIFLDGKSPLSKDAAADFMLIDEIKYDDEQLLLQLILRTKEIAKMYLDGKEII